ncbi:MAG: 22 kDa subunit of signal peptidase [Monoraphidium minutum]|nr:MAG: 22 kDa subunit of signal peptidase [Monoraphidium minutum]
MHSPWARVNAVLTFFGTVAAALCVLTTLTDFVHRADPAIKLELTGVKRLAPFRGKSDQAVLSMALDADLRSAFSWNTKQLFVYVQAEYETEENKVNQVVLWDKIVRSPSEAVISLPALKHKYALLDRGSGLRGAPLALTLGWNVMPKVGALLLHSKSFDVGPLPEEYVY